MIRLPRATSLAHDWVRARLRPGATAIDATAGNGHDTAFLAQLVGPQGRVIAFDIQAQAIAATRDRLESLGMLDRVSLRQESHEAIATVGAFDVAMFNLGYCPGGDKAIVTLSGSTERALEAATAGLSPGGLITVVCYPGHPGGREEADAVVAWTRRLPADVFRAMRCEMLVIQGDPPPFVIGIERL